jgi:predicted transcriptional regulator
MRTPTIDDRKLLRLIDKEKKSQTAAAMELGVTRQAVSHRLKELRGRATKMIVAKKTSYLVNRKLDSMEQLCKINQQANELLDAIEDDPAMAVKLMAEIRGQLKLQLEIFQTLFSLQAADEFQQSVLEAIGEVAPDVRSRIIKKLNETSGIRQVIKFY